jgi:ribosomal protein L11 methylase PrmA
MISNIKKNKLSSSFRDPDGFVFTKDNILYRQINFSYRDNYEYLFSSGLYNRLIKKNLLIKHQEVKRMSVDSKAYKIIKPDFVPFISYPYEWCFSQLKAAALVTLEIQKIALEYNMSLKDASAYNIQFYKGKPVLIDTLSFERYQEGKPWQAYRQFCQHFLAPLSLMSYKDMRFLQLSRIFIDGIPLNLAKKILPQRSKFKFSILTHIHLHAKAQNRFANSKINKHRKINKRSIFALIDNLENSINKMSWHEFNSEWNEYYSFTNYSDKAFLSKKEIINKYIEKIKPKKIWDLGANTGEFSRIASKKNIFTCSFDVDYNAIEKNYRQMLQNSERNLLPLFLDLTNPSSASGWAHIERNSLQQRGPVDMIFALALIHHLVISNNLPLNYVADYFSKLTKYLVIEFIPKKDSNVQKLLFSREDIFSNYNIKDFEKEFNYYFEILQIDKVKNSERILYLMKKK